MDKKLCNKCGIEKPITEFRKTYNKSNDKYYYRGSCHDCELLYSRDYEKNKRVITDDRKKYHKKWHEENKEYIKEYREKNKERIQQKSKEYYELNKEKLINYSKKFRNSHQEYYKNYNKQYKSENKDYISKYNKSYLQKNHESIMARRKEYYKENILLINKKRRIYDKKRRENDELYRMKTQIRHLINHSLERKGYKKNSRTYEIIGCDYDFLIDYLYRTFIDNYGIDWDGNEKVHVDHIIPLAVADTEEEVIKLCHYTNLQLLRAEDNIKKKDKLDWNLEVK